MMQEREELRRGSMLRRGRSTEMQGVWCAEGDQRRCRVCLWHMTPSSRVPGAREKGRPLFVSERVSFGSSEDKGATAEEEVAGKMALTNECALGRQSDCARLFI
jgi:hypothetical protein